MIGFIVLYIEMNVNRDDLTEVARYLNSFCRPAGFPSSIGGGVFFGFRDYGSWESGGGFTGPCSRGGVMKGLPLCLFPSRLSPGSLLVFLWSVCLFLRMTHCSVFPERLLCLFGIFFRDLLFVSMSVSLLLQYSIFFLSFFFQPATALIYFFFLVMARSHTRVRCSTNTPVLSEYEHMLFIDLWWLLNPGISEGHVAVLAVVFGSNPTFWSLPLISFHQVLY